MVGSLLFLKNILGMDFQKIATSNKDCSNEHSLIHCKFKGSKMEILKVSAKSNPNSVAGALAGVLRERGAAEIQAIGAGALNQAVKAVAIARDLLRLAEWI